jgi:hypothetical protein
VGGGNELLWQLTGGTETMTVTRSHRAWQQRRRSSRRESAVLPNNHGPQTDRLVYGLGPFQGYDTGDRTSRKNGLYDQAFVDRYHPHARNGARIIAGQFDDPYQLDEKGIFDLVNLNANDLGGIRGARGRPARTCSRASTSSRSRWRFRPASSSRRRHSAQRRLDPNSTDSLLRVWRASAARRRRPSIRQHHHRRCRVGSVGAGGPQRLPLFNAGLVGAQRQTHYLHTTPSTDVSNFGADILYPVLVRDAEVLGIYRALGVPDRAWPRSRAPRRHHQRDQPGPADPDCRRQHGRRHHARRGDHFELSQRRRLGGGTRRTAIRSTVNSVLISLIVAGNPAAGLARGVETNDKDYLSRFPFLAPAHQGLLQGHGGTNDRPVPTIPDPNAVN